MSVICNKKPPGFYFIGGVNMPFKKEHWIKTIYADSVVNTSSSTGAAKVVHTSGIYPFRVTCHNGDVYFTPNSTSPLTSNSIHLSTSYINYFEARSQNGYISLYSTSTSATAEVVLYQE
jgi:hypothetical protein